MSQDIPEIVIISDCQEREQDKDKTEDYDKIKDRMGYLVYKNYTKDTDHEPPRDIHPTTELEIGEKKNKFKIHFFYIKDSYWPAISNISRHCDGALIVIDLDNYTEEKGVEFIKEWLVNFEDLDKPDMKTIIVGASRNKKKIDDIRPLIEYIQDKKLEEVSVDINNAEDPKLKEAFNKVASLITGDIESERRPDQDEDIEEYLDKYKNF